MRLTSRNLALFASVFVVVILFALPVLAHAEGGLAKGTSTAQKIKDWVWIVLPIVCLMAGGICGLLYSLDVIRKETAYQWVLGVVFAGAIAGGIVEISF